MSCKPPGEAPLLESFLTRLCHERALNYCVICLRTQDERRLVHNKVLKILSVAINMNKDWKHYQICHICERQAVKALKFIQGVTFAAAIDTIFAELMYEKKNNKKDVFNSKVFQQVLKKFGMGDKETSPRVWEDELKDIRTATSLNTAGPLIMDHHGMVNPQENRSSSDEIYYVIPDDPCIELISDGLDNRNTEQFRVNSVQFEGYADQMGDYADPLRGYEDPLECQTNIDLTALMDDRNKDVVLISPQPQPETVVILDEEDEFTIEKLVPEHVNPDPILTHPFQITPQNSPPNTDPQKISVLDPVRIDPKKNSILKAILIENLLENSKDSVTSTGLLLGTTTGNFTMHPIAIKDGLTTIPTLDSTVFYNCEVTNTNKKTKPTSKVLEQPTTPKVSIKTTFYITNDNEDHINYAAVVKKDKDENNPHSCVKRSTGSDLTLATPSKKLKVLPVKTTDRIDWEDKIPAGVISYMNAVDPNPDPQMSPQVPQVNTPVSLKPLPLTLISLHNGEEFNSVSPMLAQELQRPVINCKQNSSKPLNFKVYTTEAKNSVNSKPNTKTVPRKAHIPQEKINLKMDHPINESRFVPQKQVQPKMQSGLKKYTVNFVVD